MRIRDFELGKTILRYITDEKGRVSLVLLPKEKLDESKRPWEEKGTYNTDARYNKEWEIGRLVQLHLSKHARSRSNGNTMKYSESSDLLKFESQDVITENSKKTIKTVLAAMEYKVIHKVTYVSGYDGLILETEFVNIGDKPLTLEMLSSFSLDNISIFCDDDGRDSYYLHRFLSGWSMEGKHICQSIEELNLGKSWVGAFYETEKFGCIGSWNVGRYFPTAALEDRKHGVIWAVQLAHNSSWQMELTRNKDSLSLSGGLADVDFGAWKKSVAPGESFSAPSAYVSTVCGDIYDACNSVVSMQKIACEAYGEKGLPICFNEFCASWGKPTQEKMLSYAETLKNKGVKYIVIDAGWSEECIEGQVGNGTWKPNRNIFPDMKKMCSQIREMGMIPGIWMEFEVTTEGSSVYDKKYDDMKLKRDGVVINQAGWRTFWDFRREDVQKRMTETVIDFLKEYGFGYIKVDYNGNIGLGCDGAESLGEGLRQHLDAVAELFKKIKREIPDIIIENCASGGHRSEPKMIGLSALTSFSDAHECVEIPYIAANLHNLMLPRQELIWATLRKEDSPQRLIYQMASVFLGRMCLSGDITELSGKQWKIVNEAIDFYKSVESVIADGTTKIYGNRGNDIVYPTGTQVVVRSNEKYILIVYHAFESAGKTQPIKLDYETKISKSFYGDNIIISGKEVTIKRSDDFSAGAILLEKK